MSCDYELYPQARADLADAYSWYENEKPGLGELFAEAAYAKIKSIAAHPTWYGSQKKGYRETKVSRKFPYSIVYKVYPARKAIVIFAIWNAKRNPRYKYRRR